MTFLTLGSYMKMNENITLITDKYSELVAIYKELEEIFGDKEIQGTGFGTALKKLNELIVDYKDISDVGDDANMNVQPPVNIQPMETQPELDIPMDIPGETQPELQIQDDETQPELQIQDEEIQEKKK